MKKNNLKGGSEILSEREMKNVMGGGDFMVSINDAPDAGGSAINYCKGKPSCEGTKKCPPDKPICVNYGIGSGKCCM